LTDNIVLTTASYYLVGRLFDRVYLIKPVSIVHPSVHMCVHPSFHEKVSLISVKFGVLVEVDE